MKKEVHVACVQMEPKLKDKAYNLLNMEKNIQSIMKHHEDVELVVFPELATTGYECGEDFYRLAENPDDPVAVTFDRMKYLARKYKLHIVFGYPEREDDRIYNSQALIDDQGKLVANYRKVHLFDSEKVYFTPGNEYVVADTALGRIGLFVCYDASFPEVARTLALSGAEILVNSTNWEIPAVLDMDIVMMARALENTCYLICSNRIGTDEDLTFFGHSMILDPTGKTLSREENPIETVLYGIFEEQVLQHTRNHYYTMLKERRPETYGRIIDF